MSRSLSVERSLGLESIQTALGGLLSFQHADELHNKGSLHKNTAAGGISGMDGQRACMCVGSHTWTPQTPTPTPITRSTFLFLFALCPFLRDEPATDVKPEQDLIRLLVRSPKWSHCHGCICPDNDYISLNICSSPQGHPFSPSDRLLLLNYGSLLQTASGLCGCSERVNNLF